MNWWIWIIFVIGYAIIGSVAAKIVDIFDIGEDAAWIGGSLEGRVEFTMILAFMFWPLWVTFFIVVSPFRGIYKLISFIFDKITK